MRLRHVHQIAVYACGSAFETTSELPTGRTTCKGMAGRVMSVRKAEAANRVTTQRNIQRSDVRAELPLFASRRNRDGPRRLTAAARLITLGCGKSGIRRRHPGPAAKLRPPVDRSVHLGRA